MFTKQQQALLDQCDMRNPVPFEELDFSKNFVYDRKYGAFYVDSMHDAAKTTLALLHLGRDDFDMMRDNSWELADYWLSHYPGCFKSSVSPNILAWTLDSLEPWEEEVIAAAGKRLVYLRGG